MLSKHKKIYTQQTDPTREELNQLVARMHKLGFYPIRILDVYDFTATGKYRREEVESAMESVSEKEIGFFEDAVYDELENMREWG